MYEFATRTVGLVVLMFFVQEAETSARIVLTADPQRSNVKSGETVRLTCKVEDSDPSTQWEYSWKKLRETKETTLSSYTGEGFSAYTLSHVTESDSAQYRCEAKVENREIISSPHTLTVTREAPKPLLTLDPPSGEIFTGDTVTLSCRAGTDPAGWEYLWYKDTLGAALTSTDSSSTDGSSYTIHSAAVSHGGEYWCQAFRGKPALYSPYSDSLQLSITAPPPAVLTLNPAWRKFYPTEKVTLKCEIQTHQTEWSYLWYRDGAPINSMLSSSGNEYTIPALNQSHSGIYSCRGKIPGRDVYTKKSNDVTLTVDALPPVVLTLQTGWTSIFNTERAALHCDIQDRSAVWMHKWYRDGRELPVGTAKVTYEILSAVQSDSGTYTCKGQHKERVLYTGSSNMVALKVNGEAPKPLLTLDSPSGEIFTGDIVTLSCRAGTDPGGWEYLWYKDTLGASLTSTDSSSTNGSRYTIHSAAVSHGGEYWCRAGRGRPAFYTPYSDSLQLSITARPQAVLTLETAWTEIFRSDSLTLRCQVEGSSAEWNYTWYRDGRHLPLDPSGDRLTLTAGNDSYSSEYKCRGNRIGQPSYTEISEGFRENNIVSCTVENLARITVGAAILLFLSVIVNEGFWRRARKMRRCCI